MSQSSLPFWALVLAGVLVGGSVFFYVARLFSFEARSRRTLFALRLLSGVLVLFLFLEPALEFRQTARGRDRFLVILDRSKSMRLPHQDVSRAKLLGQHFEESRGELERLSASSDVQLYSFGEKVRRADEGFPVDAQLTEGETRFDALFRKIEREVQEADVSGVLVYSDGVDTEDMPEDYALGRASELGVPIYTVGVPVAHSSPDVSISRVWSDDFAFVHNPLAIDVEVTASGIEVDEIDVYLKSGGEILKTKTARFKNGRAAISFETKPREVGRVVYEVSVSELPEETLLENNKKAVVIKVIRDRIRVLHVAGRPSWDQRFLRSHLKGNANIDLISFFILRTTTDLQKAPQSELALIPFPVHELFTTEISTFDVIIFQNFNYLPYRMARYLPNVRRFVQEGGGFLMLGGDKSFEDGYFASTAISDILPVKLGGARAYDEGEFSPRVTRAGRRHPITGLGRSGRSLEAVLQKLPKLVGFNNSLGLSEGAQALLAHGSLPGNPPLVAIRDVGKGRSVALMTDSFWLWSFAALGSGAHSGREYDQFFSSQLRWLVKDPELSRVRLTTDQAAYEKDDEVSVRVRVLGTDYQGLENAQIALRVLDANGGVVGKEMKGRSGDSGFWRTKLKTLEPAVYSLEASATSDKGRVGVVSTPLVIQAFDRELHETRPRPELLRAIASGSKGQYVPYDEPLPELHSNEAERLDITRRKQVPIWNNLIVLVALVAALGGEWWVRRKTGLI